MNCWFSVLFKIYCIVIFPYILAEAIISLSVICNINGRCDLQDIKYVLSELFFCKLSLNFLFKNFDNFYDENIITIFKICLSYCCRRYLIMLLLITKTYRFPYCFHITCHVISHNFGWHFSDFTSIFMNE